VEGFTSTGLDPSTWDAFADLVTRDGGVWGGCWCLEFHPEGKVIGGFDERRDEKRRLVGCGRAHAALVFDGDLCVGWCQFGPSEELVNIKSKRAYDAAGEQPSAWRITCFYTGKGYRRRGVADVGLAGALELIAELGGGTVESFPEDTVDRKVSSSFLHNATLATFERHGFVRVRKLAKHRWLVRAEVEPSTASGPGS
jgi:ribosomal protein S18 acetylase RimI-like enzyme